MKFDNTSHSASDNYFLPDTDYIKLRQDGKITCLYTLLPPRRAAPSKEPARPEKKKRGRPRKKVVPPTVEEVKEPELTLKGMKSGTFKIEKGKDYIYIEDYEELTAHFKGGYRLNTYRLLDFLIWQLSCANHPDGEGKYTAPLCTQIALPLDQYIRCCGYEAVITASKRKDTQKELQKDLQLLCATLIGWDDGCAVRILDAGCVRNDQIIVSFSARMADHLLNHCKSMWYPLKLMQLSGKSLFAYSLGRSMALHSSIISNQQRGTDRTFSVRKLLQYCPRLPTMDEVRARNGNYRQAIIRPFTEALDKLCEMDVIDWDWRYHSGEEFPENYDDLLKDYVEYSVVRMPES